MKRSTLPLAALFATGVRADCTPMALTTIPSCAQACFVSGAAAIRCGSLDFACQCRQQAGLYATIESCVASSCAPSEFQNVIDGAAAVCECSRRDWGVVKNPSHPAGSYAPSPLPSLSPPSATPPPVTATSSGKGGGGGASPTRSAPPSSATSSVTGAAGRPAGSGLGFVCAGAVALGFAAL
ncbi:hypothetical protein C8A01DRAFT_38447 [Parachaetomium inaequale]|uniref:CFEM domain-containing protein n=1 Tax=Parachaetomium inaequale TaxID=2588326 RepID=A0AAN6SPS5_9PEZI|nr:hypothetical protein C8A01DRAFT_38447 [Parachaetomium inaequale]